MMFIIFIAGFLSILKGSLIADRHGRYSAQAHLMKRQSFHAWRMLTYALSEPKSMKDRKSHIAPLSKSD